MRCCGRSRPSSPRISRRSAGQAVARLDARRRPGRGGAHLRGERRQGAAMARPARNRRGAGGLRPDAGGAQGRAAALANVAGTLSPPRCSRCALPPRRPRWRHLPRPGGRDHPGLDRRRHPGLRFSGGATLLIDLEARKDPLLHPQARGQCQTRARADRLRRRTCTASRRPTPPSGWRAAADPSRCCMRAPMPGREAAMAKPKQPSWRPEAASMAAARPASAQAQGEPRVQQRFPRPGPDVSPGDRRLPADQPAAQGRDGSIT
jgi:hypothetical protein